MRALAEFIMRGRLQATLVVVGSAAVPMLFWLSAAAGSLVLLRRGLSDVLSILGWAVLPAIGWWLFGDPRVALVLGGTLLLAVLLRSGQPWSKVVLWSVALGLGYGLILMSAFHKPIESLAEEMQKLLPGLFEGVQQQLTADEQARLESLIVPVLTGLFAAVLQSVALLCLILGRYWQALLYNPGGFGREFRALRLPLPLALALMLGMLLGPNLGSDMAMLTPICSVPLVFAALALLHGLVAQQRLGRFWLVGVYVTLVLFMQLIYPLLVVLAVVDSLFDFRSDRVSRKGPGDTDGKG